MSTRSTNHRSLVSEHQNSSKRHSTLDHLRYRRLLIAAATGQPQSSKGPQSRASLFERLECRTLLSAIDYATFLGGNSLDDAFAVAVDAASNTYLTGMTASTDFPATPGAFDGTLNGIYDAFVAKIRPNGTLAWATYLGGDGDERGHGIALDNNGNIYVIGRTDSADFPITAGSLDTTLSGGADAFVTKLSADGTALAYSTFLGGAGFEIDQGFDKLARRIGGIAVDAAGQAYVTGSTTSADFPTTLGAFDTAGPGFIDAFVSKLNAAGSALVYSTYLGGEDIERGHDIAVDAGGNSYVTGEVWSMNFPTTAGAFQPTLAGGGTDNFVTKLNAAGSGLVYSSYLGGTRGEFPGRLAVDAAGQAYVTGATTSFDFPITAGAFQTERSPSGHLGGPFDAFVTKVNAAGSALVYSTYLGGGFGNDYGEEIALDGSGQAYVTGFAESGTFPVANAFQPSRNGLNDAFVTKLNASGTALVYSSYLGGDNGGGSESGYGIAVDGSDVAHIVGSTISSSFPTTTSAFQRFGAGGRDAFVARISNDTVAPTVSSSEFAFAPAPQAIRFSFSENVSASLSVADLLLENLSTDQTIPSGNIALSYDLDANVASFTFPGYEYGALPDGDYRGILPAGSVTDPSGNPLVQHTFDFFFLSSDANRDRQVNLADFNILAANFGQSSRTFSQGDFNYDGQVNLADFNILAGRYGNSLSAALSGRGSGFSEQLVSSDNSLEELLA